MRRPKFVLEAIERRNETVLKITLTNVGRNNIRYARLDEQGRIVYDKPEKVPDRVKRELAPAFFKKLRRSQLGIT